MAKYFGILLLGFLTSCSNYGQLSHITDLPKKLEENSGLVYYTKENVWLIEDNGNLDEIYNVNFEGKIKKKLKVSNAKNHDWEDLTKDKEGNIYIGDFGNNQNDRKDLVIYKIPNPEKEKGKKIKAEKIKFNYPEQKEFPPKDFKMYYDTEAFFHQNDSLYIITKNRTKPFDGKALIYKIPASPGSYKAEFISSFVPCLDWKNCQVTSADISSNGKKIAILSYGKLWIFSDFTFPDFTKGKMEMIDLETSNQLESVCFKDNNTLLLSDEKKGPTGRNLYFYKLK
ncbi:hypothetical protein GGR42_001572 [Saonia flava]|uniref:Uncharacterized protein n=1 Tax=Saonia flava TaxID=523696 RepID=A0A846QW04_9FLAO|nr:hypothetical protein [Saonia flava]NJB71110.1 hypothetical protein [Saonia flava]